jgi:hypothetical protein
MLNEKRNAENSNQAEPNEAVKLICGLGAVLYYNEYIDYDPTMLRIECIITDPYTF